MTRHSKNATAHAVYTYHERRADSKISGYGSQELRLGKDSVKEFDCCSLTLQPCRDPVVTPEGNLYDKEAILEYMVTQKQEISRKVRLFEKESSRMKQLEEEEKHTAQEREKIMKFFEGNKSACTVGIPTTSKEAQGSGSSGGGYISNRPAVKLPSFWVPSETPKAERSKLDRPDDVVRCPVSGNPLRYKDLISVKFTPMEEREKVMEPAKAIRGLHVAQSVKYKCAVSGDVLTNYTHLCVLRPSGAVVTQDCVNRLIRKDMIDPIVNVKLKDKDIIALRRGATGFAEVGVSLKAKKEGPVMQA